MSTPYGISTSIGSMSYNNYVNTPIFGPLSTNKYPFAIPYHSYGTLSGLRPNPPLFYPSQNPPYADQFTNARRNYYRTAESLLSTAIKKQRQDLTAGMAFYDYSTGTRHNVSSHMNYIKPVESSLYINKVKAQAVGKGSYKIGLPLEADYTTKNYHKSDVRTCLRRARSGGCVAPKKKGAIENHYLTNGQVCAWGSVPRQTY